MKKILVCVSFMTLVMMVCSCKKDKETGTTPVTYPNYSQFKVGTYWVYERYFIDSEGHASPMNVFDSCYVQKDTVINNLTYIKMFRPDPYYPEMSNSFVRDSLHYIVAPGGKILFSSKDFQTVFESKYITSSPYDTITFETVKMEDKDVTFITPAGAFVTCDHRSTYHMYPNWSSAGNPRYLHQRYAENVGIVAETFPFFVSSPNYTERRLVRYHINI